MLDHTKTNVPLSLKSQSVTYKKGQIYCISSLRYHLADVFKALKEMESYSLEKRVYLKTIHSLSKLVYSCSSSFAQMPSLGGSC